MSAWDRIIQARGKQVTLYNISEDAVDTSSYPSSDYSGHDSGSTVYAWFMPRSTRTAQMIIDAMGHFPDCEWISVWKHDQTLNDGDWAQDGSDLWKVGEVYTAKKLGVDQYKVAPLMRMQA